MMHSLGSALAALHGVKVNGKQSWLTWRTYKGSNSPPWLTIFSLQAAWKVWVIHRLATLFPVNLPSPQWNAWFGHLRLCKLQVSLQGNRGTEAPVAAVMNKCFQWEIIENQSKSIPFQWCWVTWSGLCGANSLQLGLQQGNLSSLTSVQVTQLLAIILTPTASSSEHTARLSQALLTLKDLKLVLRLTLVLADFSWWLKDCVLLI